MKLRIGKPTIDVWLKALKMAGERETGGILFGEHVAERDFRLVEVSTQRLAGTPSSFGRRGSDARTSLKCFSEKYGQAYERFNYLGEWHSHPNCEVTPSRQDCVAMRDLLAHPDTNANFLVLIILGLRSNQELELSACVFLKSGQTLPCEVILESKGADDE